MSSRTFYESFLKGNFLVGDKMEKKLLNFSDNLAILNQYNLDINGRCIHICGSSEDSSIRNNELNVVIKGISVLEEISQKNHIDFTLSTSGGEIDVGFGIYDAIKATKSPTRIYCFGKCSSMGVVILQAADERYAFPNTKFMIHEGSLNFGDAEVDYGDVEREAKDMKRYLDSMVNVFHERTGLTKKFLMSKIRGKDYIFDAKEALSMNFIDKIIDSF